MKLNRNKHITKDGIVKKNPDQGPFIVFNRTDGIVASLDDFNTKRKASEFIKIFKKRFEKQGYYFTRRMERIPISDVELEIIPRREFWKSGKRF